MNQRTWCKAVLAMLVCAGGTLFPAPVQGGQILDWLFGTRPTASQPVVAYYPPSAYVQPTGYAPSSGAAYQTFYGGQPTVTYQVPAANPCAPTVACPPPTACCPPPTICPPQPQSCWSRLGNCFGARSSQPMAVPSVNPIPQTYYRTSWKRVPVTSYRPMTSTDPITGCPVTVMKPCTTYTWQAERRQCNFFDRLLGRCDRAPAAVQPCCVPTTCVPTTPSCCSDSAVVSGPTMASPAPTPAPAPYYAPGGATMVPGSVPAPSMPSPTLSPQTLPPNAGAPSSGAGSTPGPADRRPSLKPAEDDAASSELTPLPLTSPQPPSGAMGGTQEGTGTSPLPSIGPPETGADGVKLSPVPDPDATPAPQDRNNAPQLLNPHDQTASLRTNQRWAYSAISWPEKPRQPATVHGAQPRSVTSGAPATPIQRSGPAWDESGWHSVR